MKQSLRGSLYLLTAAFFFGSYGIWSKLMGNSFGVFYQAWTRSLIILGVVVIVGLLTKSFKKIARRDRKWFALYTVAGALTFAPYFYSFQHLPVGTAVLLFYASLTLGTFILGKFAFNERLTLVKIASLILGFMGLFLLFSFSLPAHDVVYGLLAMAGGAAGAVEVTFTKKVSANYSSLQVTAMDFFAVAVVNLVISLVLREPQTLPALTTPWFAQLGYAASQLAAFTLAVLGYKYVEASVGGVIGLMEIVFGVLFGVLIFREPLTASIIVGGLCIMISAGLSNIVTLKK